MLAPSPAPHHSTTTQRYRLRCSALYRLLGEPSRKPAHYCIHSRQGWSRSLIFTPTSRGLHVNIVTNMTRHSSIHKVGKTILHDDRILFPVSCTTEVNWPWGKNGLDSSLLWKLLLIVTMHFVGIMDNTHERWEIWISRKHPVYRNRKSPGQRSNEMHWAVTTISILNCTLPMLIIITRP